MDIKKLLLIITCGSEYVEKKTFGRKKLCPGPDKFI